MKTIYKYDLNRLGTSEIYMPKDAELLQVARQNSSLSLWAMVNPDNSLELRRFLCVETGGYIDEELTIVYLNTALFYGDNYVLHVFEIK